MAHNWNIIGHKKQTEYLSKSIESGKLSHAYVFSGPESVGKRETAYNFARILLCEQGNACKDCVQCKSFSSLSNPDFIEIRSQETIKIDQIRQLNYQLSLKPYSAKYKVAVIDSADNMTTESANALLKLLEEPKPFNVIILVTNNGYRLLPTILSRAQRISFGFVANEEFKNSLKSSLTAEQLEVVLDLAAGRPGHAKTVANDPEQLAKLTALNQQYKQLNENDLVEKLRLAADLAEAETAQIKQTLQFWLNNLERKLLNEPTQILADRISSLMNAQLLLDANVNTKLLLTQLMIDLNKK